MTWRSKRRGPEQNHTCPDPQWRVCGVRPIYPLSASGFTCHFVKLVLALLVAFSAQVLGFLHFSIWKIQREIYTSTDEYDTTCAQCNLSRCSQFPSTEGGTRWVKILAFWLASGSILRHDGWFLKMSKQISYWGFSSRLSGCLSSHSK